MFGMRNVQRRLDEVEDALCEIADYDEDFVELARKFNALLDYLGLEIDEPDPNLIVRKVEKVKFIDDGPPKVRNR